MTRRVLVSPRLPELRSGNAEIDRWFQQAVQPWIAQAFEQFSFLTPDEGDWTAIVQGSGTAGTYEIASQESHYYRIGDWVFLSTYITLAGALTAGGVGDLNITGVPFTKRASHNPVGTITLSGVNWTAGANLAIAFSTDDESAVLRVVETNDNAAGAALAIGSLAASDLIAATICYLAAE